MGQFQKDEIKAALLEAAKKEFLSKGFNGASMRTIAANADQKPANIYNYFKNKDDLFEHLVEPTISAVKQGLGFMADWRPSTEQPIYTIDEERAAIHIIIDYMDKNRDEVTLLVFRSQGSKREKWFNQTTRQASEVFLNAIDAVTEISPTVYHNKPSEFFTLNLVRFFYNSLLSMLKYDMNKEEMIEKSEEVLVFYYTGIVELLKRK